MQEHSRLGRETVSWSPVSPLQAPGQPSSFQSVITETAAPQVAFETTWQHTSPDLHKDGKTVKTSEASKEGVKTKERVCEAEVTFFPFFFHLTNKGTITGKVTLRI